MRDVTAGNPGTGSLASSIARLARRCPEVILLPASHADAPADAAAAQGAADGALAGFDPTRYLAGATSWDAPLLPPQPAAAPAEEPQAEEAGAADGPLDRFAVTRLASDLAEDVPSASGPGDGPALVEDPAGDDGTPPPDMDAPLAGFDPARYLSGATRAAPPAAPPQAALPQDSSADDASESGGLSDDPLDRFVLARMARDLASDAPSDAPDPSPLAPSPDTEPDVAAALAGFDPTRYLSGAPARNKPAERAGSPAPGAEPPAAAYEPADEQPEPETREGWVPGTDAAREAMDMYRELGALRDR